MLSAPYPTTNILFLTYKSNKVVDINLHLEEQRVAFMLFLRCWDTPPQDKQEDSYFNPDIEKQTNWPTKDIFFVSMKEGMW